MKVYFLPLLLSLFISTIAADTEQKEGGHPKPHVWGYNIEDGNAGPEHWARILPDRCGEHLKRQSPIDIESAKATYDEALNDVTILDEQDDDKKMYLLNNGHGAKVAVENAEVFVIGGGLGEMFKVAQFHFHWGSSDQTGSEHTVNGKQYPLEMHIVTYDSERYSSLGEAVTGQDSLAVFGTLFTVGGEDNEHFSAIIDRLKDVTEPDKTKVELPWLDLKSLVPAVTDKYYRYLGSLTTPTCDESVVWTVFATPNTISSAQLEEFRELIEGRTAEGDVIHLEDNWRPPQPLHGRQVTASFTQEASYQVVNADEDPENSATINQPQLIFFFTLISVFLQALFL